jgi:hypothetical protein
MSEFGGRADVQQIQVIAVVMNAVLPSSANFGHYRDSCELLKSSKFRRSQSCNRTLTVSQ